MKRVSVAMAAYNGEKYIRYQIDSILQQLGDKDELVISDDGSSDRTTTRAYSCCPAPDTGSNKILRMP